MTHYTKMSAVRCVRKAHMIVLGAPHHNNPALIYI